jgi:uncharacterized NAD(P)/FAD-binding protein YdhS
VRTIVIVHGLMPACQTDFHQIDYDCHGRALMRGGTGPQYDLRHTRERLLRSLVAEGLAVPVALGLGIATDDRGALMDASGRTATNLFYIGPMLRPRFWETTAVQELRMHAEHLTRHVAESVASRRTQFVPGSRSSFPAFL